MLAGICTFLNMYATQAILPELAADFGASMAEASLTVTLPLLAVALLAPCVGAVSDRLGRKRLIVAAAFALLAPTLLCAAAPSIGVLLLGRALQGVMLPFVFTVTVAYIGDECVGDDAIRVTAGYAGGSIIGGFCGRFMGGIVAAAAGWRMSFVALTLATLLCAAGIAALLPPERRFQPTTGGVRASLSAYAEHLRNPRLIATCAVGFGMLFANVAMFTYVNFMLVEPPFDLNPAQLGLVFVVYLVGLVASNLAARLALRIGRRATVSVALALSSAGLAVTLVQALPAVIAGLALATGGLMSSQAMALSYIGVAVRRARSAAVGAYVMTFYVGGALGGALPGLVWPRLGWPGVVAMIYAALALMFGASLCWTVPREAP